MATLLEYDDVDRTECVIQWAWVVLQACSVKIPKICKSFSPCSPVYHFFESQLLIFVNSTCQITYGNHPMQLW